jgi:hypothetical protein
MVWDRALLEREHGEIVVEQPRCDIRLAVDGSGDESDLVSDENLSPARFRVGDLLITHVGTWVIVGKSEENPWCLRGVGFAYSTRYGSWIFRMLDVAREQLRTDRVIR